MTEYKVEDVFFEFPDDWTVELFDTWKKYSKVSGMVGAKGCDILASDGSTLWIVEVKDYTYESARPPSDLDVIVGRKALGTMGLLYSLQRSAHGGHEIERAQEFAQATELRLALHVELKDGGQKSRYLPRDLAPIKTKLSRVAKALGIAKVEISASLIAHQAPWTTWRDPAARGNHRDR